MQEPDSHTDEQGQVPSPTDQEVLDLLAEAQRQYLDYLEVAFPEGLLRQLLETQEQERPKPPRVDLPLTLGR